MIRLTKTHNLILLILIIALFLRTYHLSSNPFGFFCDEAAVGYDAYSILTTGKDMYGVSFPVFFRSLDDYRHPIAVYSTIPFIYFFHLTELAVRLQSVFYGLLTIIFLYLIGKAVISKQYGLWAAFVASCMPWLLFYNRTGFEFSTFPAFFTATIYFFIKSLTNRKYIIPFFIVSALTIYTYQPAKLLVPLFLTILIIIFWKKLFQHTKELFSGILIFVILSLPFITSLISGEGFARFNSVSVFSQHLPLMETIEKLLYNYFFQLSPQYLFFVGEPTFINRHMTLGITPLLFITSFGLVLGLIALIKTIKTDFSKILIIWLLIYPLAATLVSEAPYSSRALIGAPVFALLIALGLEKIAQYIVKTRLPYRWAVFLIVTCVSLNFLYFAQFYFIVYPKVSAGFWGWQYGPREIIPYFVAHQDNYDELYMIGEFNAPDIFLKFYAPYTCQKCRIGNPENNGILGRKQLFAVTSKYLEERPYIHFLTQKYIYYPDGTIAFQIGQIISNLQQ